MLLQLSKCYVQHPLFSDYLEGDGARNDKIAVINFIVMGKHSRDHIRIITAQVGKSSSNDFACFLVEDGPAGLSDSSCVHILLKHFVGLAALKSGAVFFGASGSFLLGEQADLSHHLGNQFSSAQN